MKKFQFFVCAVLSFWTLSNTTLQAQNGDQILDGIGETGLIARYVFNGDAKDWSRNNLHGKIEENKAKFVNDEFFGKVLSLPADSKAFVSIPGDGLIGEESLSISGWIFLRTAQKGQTVFDFGKSTNSHLFFAPTGTENETGAQTQVITEKGAKHKTQSPALEAGKWNHVAVVINIPSKSISTFVNGKLAAETKNADLDLSKLFDYNTASKNKLYIGKSLGNENSYLNAKLHDFRIYRVALTDKQITRIFNNAFREGEEEESGEEKTTDLPKFASTTPQLYNQFLTNVSDVKVQTVAGTLPRLPSYVKGVYRDGIQGPEVRVIWPSPKDNSQALKSGQYTVIGTVSGPDLKPKAVVTVIDRKATASPKRKLESFKLEEVSLNADADGHQTKFIENRD
ncbi:MAG TPA: LamG-like jellyroll fold domain-containing protein, partial [Flavobacterium sp.]|nr:LamG-like jellyroll fold domain-containing protein [Flavobacterium sp.]